MLEETARKYALQNALNHGKATIGPVIGRIMAEFPEERKRSGEVKAVVEAVVDEVNLLSPEDVRRMLEAAAPELLERKKVEKKNVLAELPDVSGRVVMRFAPGPSGPLHIGHTRAALLNDEYVKRYGGEYILRMEDTNPDKIDPEAYDTIPEDMEWLGIHMDNIFLQSDRFDKYYAEASALVEAGQAYVCTCPAEEWREAKLAKRACTHREEPPEEQMERWEGMLSGKYAMGEATLAVKTRLDDPNPALRDFAAFRIVSSPHPRTGSKYLVYPLYNFSVAVDDHDMGMTHVLRGKDHLNNTMRQKYIYKYRGWKEPCFLHYGWVSIEDAVLKTSIIREGIADGTYKGWDDVRLGTIRAIAKRGISPDALRRYWLDVGIKQVDIEFSWDTLYALNRDIVDSTAQRLFFVADPVPLQVVSQQTLSCRAPRHPDKPEMGTRNTTVSPGEDVFLPRCEVEKLEPGCMIRLKDLGNFIFSQGKLEYKDNDIGVLKKGVSILHWVHKPSGLPCTILLHDGTEDKGVVEALASGTKGVVQFERYGFVNMLSWDENGGLGAYAHR